MQISAKTEYACLAMLELAIHADTGQPVRIRQIAETHGIPSRFLVQILLQLKGAGLVASTRGAAGGYRLAKDPQDITLADVMTVIEGHRSELTSSAARSTEKSRALLKTWKEVDTLQRQMLSSITFADLAERVRDETGDMYYI